MPDKKPPELLRQLGPIGKFKPQAQFISHLNEVVVYTKDCSYIAKYITPWFELFIDNNRPWYQFWGKYVGFSVYCPGSFGLCGETPVNVILDRIAEQTTTTGDPFGGHLKLACRLFRGLTVSLPHIMGK